MNKNKILKAKKSVELCNMPAEDNVCKQCPYYSDKGNLYECMDKRYKDLIEILDWSIKTIETLEGLLRRER